MVKKITRRGDISHVEQEKIRLGDKFNPANEDILESLPYDMDINLFPENIDMRASLPAPLLVEPALSPVVQSEKSGSVQSQPTSIIQSLSDRYNVEKEALGKLLNKNNIQKPNELPKENVDDKSKDKTFIKRQYDKGHNLYVKGANVVQKIDNAVGATENFLGVENLNSKNDKFAIEGGSKYLSDTLLREDNRLNKLYESHESQRAILASQYAEQQQETLNYQNKLRDLYTEEQELKNKPNKTPEEINRSVNISSDIRRINNLVDTSNNKELEIKDKIDTKANQLRQTTLLLQRNQDNKAEYDKAVLIGKLKYQKEHGAGVEARRFAKDFSDNVTSMIGAPNIGDISAQVGYGDIGAKSVSSGINTMFGNYKLNPGANEWVKTKAGDRGLVEALVKVNQNNMITPFGAPGTIQNSKLSSQFNYNLPVRQIGVGEVTARPGYRLTPEDIHRKKKSKVKPSLVRKSPKSNVKKVTVKGSLSMNMKSPVIATIGNMKSNSVKLTMDNITPFTSKNFEMNLNTISKPVMKKKLLKVKL